MASRLPARSNAAQLPDLPVMCRREPCAGLGEFLLRHHRADRWLELRRCVVQALPESDESPSLTPGRPTTDDPCQSVRLTEIVGGRHPGLPGHTRALA